ncbi:MAG: amidohydrolase family protein [Verrucomicrobiota bacterium]
MLLPGLINAHCHLDYTCMKGAMFASQSFPEWIRRINGIKKSLGPDDFLQSIYDGFNELMDTGCTTVLNIEAFPELLNRLEPPPIRTWWFLELIDIRNKLVDDASLLGMLQFFDYKKEWLGGFGLSPHAPYTASVDLYRLAKTAARKLNMLVTTHIAESIEEQSMFLYGEGALYDFLSSLGRDMSDCAQGSALSHLIEFGAIDRNTIAAHLNYLQEYDWEALASTPMHIVHCPKCHAFFGHYRFPLEQLTQVGCNIMLGTDSLASNNKLDLRSEIRQARQFYSEISAREWLEMVTTRPAKAIGMEDKLGIIKKDALADLTAFMLPADSEPHEAVIRSRDVPALLMVDGVVKEGFDIKPVCIS